jgi:hypothetical protein
MLVQIRMSPMSVFQYPIDDVKFDAPEEFRPAVGDRVSFDRFRDPGGEHRKLDVYVVSVEWRLLVDSPAVAGYQNFMLILVLTVSSDAPPSPRDGRKK